MPFTQKMKVMLCTPNKEHYANSRVSFSSSFEGRLSSLYAHVLNILGRWGWFSFSPPLHTKINVSGEPTYWNYIHGVRRGGDAERFNFTNSKCLFKTYLQSYRTCSVSWWTRVIRENPEKMYVHGYAHMCVCLYALLCVYKDVRVCVCVYVLVA